jgi:hypothetical protein
MSKKLLNRYAKQYALYQLEGSEGSASEKKELSKFIEEDFKAGFTTALHILQKENEKMAMLRVILDQHFDADEVNLEEVGKAVGICFGYL